MNRTRLIFIGILALAVGAVASILAFRLLQSRAVAAQSGGVDVVVAAADINVGTRIQDKDVRGKRGFWTAFHDSSWNASGGGTGERFQFGCGICTSRYPGGCADDRQPRRVERAANNHCAQENCGAGNWPEVGPESVVRRIAKWR